MPDDFWSRHDIRLLLGTDVAHIDRDAHTLRLGDDRYLAYRVLVIATGGTPRRLAVRGNGTAQLSVLRTLDDAKRLREQMQPGRRLIVVGGGVIGLEVASTALKLGLTVEVFESAEHPMGRILCQTSSNWLTQLHREAGVKLHLGAHLDRVDLGLEGFQFHARLADGCDYAALADIGVAAIGVDTAQPFLTEAGLGDRDGVPVNALCKSPFDPACYAAGDVARTDSAYHGRAQRQETWRNAENQARAVAEFIQGRSEPYIEIPWMWTDQHGRNIQVVGIPEDGAHTVVRGEPGTHPFSIFWIRNGVVRGGVLVDSSRDRRPLEQLVASGRTVKAESLINPAVPLKSLT
jgi:3-phenylpropionate/trans-cinnamate dioxygenase ferredoxin reductase subunit